MALYQEVIEELKKENQVTELYRFQGAKSFEYFDIRKASFDEKCIDHYAYFSSSVDHHKYFSIRRIRQLLNRIVLKDTPYQISSKDIRDSDTYPKIKNLVLNNEKLQDLYSIRLIVNNYYRELLKENCMRPEEKQIGKKSIERVDRRVYGGGYGIATEWKELLGYLTYFNASQKINRYDIINILEKMRQTGKINQKGNISFLLEQIDNYQFKLNPDLESDFTKYKIMNILEVIMEKELYIKNSTLGKYPSKTIKKVVNEYERGKRKVLEKMKDKTY